MQQLPGARAETNSCCCSTSHHQGCEKTHATVVAKPHDDIEHTAGVDGLAGTRRRNGGAVGGHLAAQLSAGKRLYIHDVRWNTRRRTTERDGGVDGLAHVASAAAQSARMRQHTLSLGQRGFDAVNDRIPIDRLRNGLRNAPPGLTGWPAHAANAAAQSARTRQYTFSLASASLRAPTPPGVRRPRAAAAASAAAAAACAGTCCRKKAETSEPGRRWV